VTAGSSNSPTHADKVGTAQWLDSGNTIVLFGADIDLVTLAAKNPQTFTLVEADSKPEANAVAVLDFQTPGAHTRPGLFPPHDRVNRYPDCPQEHSEGQATIRGGTRRYRFPRPG
jgi:hypothetical protein